MNRFGDRKTIQAVTFKGLVMGIVTTLTFILLSALFDTGLSSSVVVTSIIVGALTTIAFAGFKLLIRQEN